MERIAGELAAAAEIPESDALERVGAFMKAA
jgi:hypothetical protein